MPRPSFLSSVDWRIAAGLALGSLAAPSAIAAITTEKTLVAETPEAFEKGISYPLIGLHDAAPTFLSARVYKWTQSGDQMYVLEPTDDFTVYPELVRIGSDTRKSVTIKAARPLPRGRELDYRIILREFDRADGTDNPPSDSDAAFGIRVKPQVSVPMIVRAPAGVKAAALQITGLREAAPPTEAERKQGAVQHELLGARNPGGIYQRIAAIGINEPAGEKNQVVAYVLPETSLEIPIKLKRGDHVQIRYVNGPDAKLDIRGKGNDDSQIVDWIVP